MGTCSEFLPIPITRGTNLQAEELEGKSDR